MMIASELQRGISMIDRSDRAQFRGAMERAFELLDLTVAVSTCRNEIRELLRLREIMAQSFIDDDTERTQVELMMNALLSMDRTAFRQLAANDQ